MRFDVRNEAYNRIQCHKKNMPTHIAGVNAHEYVLYQGLPRWQRGGAGHWKLDHRSCLAEVLRQGLDDNFFGHGRDGQRLPWWGRRLRRRGVACQPTLQLCTSKDSTFSN